LAKILVIEDDLTFLDLVRALLESAGHEVVTAEDAALGLRAVISESPDLIIFDIFIPYLDGFELLETLRTDPATRPIPVIVLTGRGDDDIYARVRKLGVSDFFTKPVERDRLIGSIERLLTPGRADPEPR